MGEKIKRGPVEILCREIGVRFSKDLERPEMLVAFVRVLHERLEHMYWTSSAIERHSKNPIDASDARHALDRLAAVLRSTEPDALIAGAAEVRTLIHGLKWEGNWASHIFDIVGSLASALRFGLKKPVTFSSRHAAEAASHLWRREYGISKFDEFTGEWQKSWARHQFDTAIRRLAFPASAAPSPEDGQEA